ncbi:MAG: PEP-CTERM sorting domain-containing protein [Gammaproteobacteria bacterium]|nr:PEP-CTERM sorting domain-containing protein [Gammaproteobacteria bacterium]
MHSTNTVVLAAFCAISSLSASATLVSITNCTGAIDCVITTTPPNPVLPNPNDGILLTWDERQNVTLTEDLRVDRVFDPTADFITALGNGDFLIQAGTIVSSHYLQWDPGNGSSSTVSATINLDSQVFAFITADQNLFDSDDALGLPGLDYNDFRLRGLEGGDTTVFNGENTDIRWSAGSPGDWTRLITAYSPTASVPEPASLLLPGVGLAGLGFATRRKKA